jgi:hypothetical protein
MSKTSIKPSPDEPTPKRDDHLATKPAEAANLLAPEVSEKDLSRFRWSLLIWILGFGFIWAILILEGVIALISMVRRAFGGG